MASLWDESNVEKASGDTRWRVSEMKLSRSGMAQNDAEAQDMTGQLMSADLLPIVSI